MQKSLNHSLKILFLGFLFTGSLAQAQESVETVTTTTTKTYRREMIEENGQLFYVVNARAPHLYMISRDLYGDEKHWSEIAKWNNLQAPYSLEAGQRLLLKTPPSNNDMQGDSDLIKTWTVMQRWPEVKGIEQSQQGALPLAAEAPTLAEEESVETPKEATLKEELGGPVEAPAVTAPPPSEPVVVKEAEKLHSHSKWHFGIAAAGSIFELQSDNHTAGVNNKLNSEVDYGVDLEAAYHFSDKSSLFFTAMVEHMDISHSDDVEVEGHSQYIWKFSSGLESEVTENLSLAGSLIYEQLPFVEPTSTGVKVDAIYIPQLSFGGRINFISSGNFKADLVVDVLLLMSKYQGGYDIKNGEGFVAGFKFKNQFQHSALTYGVTYRYIEQNTADADNNQKAVFANLGLAF